MPAQVKTVFKVGGKTVSNYNIFNTKGEKQSFFFLNIQPVRPNMLINNSENSSKKQKIQTGLLPEIWVFKKKSYTQIILMI